MDMERKWKLALLLLTALLALSGCAVQPDPTLEPLQISNEVPFGTAVPILTAAPTPEPTPSPEPTMEAWTGNDQNTWEDWSQGALPTTTPRTAATAAPGVQSWQTSQTDYNAGYPVLRLGSTGQDVQDLQLRLAELRYFDGTADGRYGLDTQTAIREFQEKNGLTMDGIAGRETQDLLYSSAARAKVVSATSDGEEYLLLKTGASGFEVRKLQGRLAELGYYAGGVDGLYGETTADAVRAFQRANNLSADGQAGAQTQKKLYSATAVYAKTPVATADPDQTRTLSLGMTGNDVYALQQRLIELRYLNGVADGVFGEETMNALIAFQKNNNITPDGQAGAATLKRLSGSARAASGSTPTPVPLGASVLHEGDYGEAVLELQSRLFSLGYYAGRIDGRFGADTTQAVREFQAANNLSVDGVPGRGTLSKLQSSSAVPKSASAQVSVTAQPAETVYEALRRGMSGDAVVRLQNRLAELGYITFAADGDFGAGTERAVKLFQEANGLTADGVAGRGTQAILFSQDAKRRGQTSAPAVSASTPTPKPNTDTVLQWQSQGSDVLQYQARLSELGYLSSKNVTGTFNQPTVDATKAFQTMNGLKVDGAAGPQSLKLIYSEDALNADGVRVGDLVGSASPLRVLTAGATGEQVQQLQSQLAQLGYLSASFSSGVYDEATRRAVEEFQRMNGLTADGAAGEATFSRLFAASSVAAGSGSAALDNAARAQGELRLNGALQANLSGGGIAAGSGNAVVLVKDGQICLQRNGQEAVIAMESARFLHVTNGRVYYVSQDMGEDVICRMNLDGTAREILCRCGVVLGFALHDGVMYYLDANGTLKERTLSGEESVLMDGVADFSIDVEKNTALCVCQDRVVSFGLLTAETGVLYSGSAQQALPCGESVLILAGGNVLELSGGRVNVLRRDKASRIGVYEDTLLEVTDKGILACRGGSSQLILSGRFTRFSVAGGTVYAGGESVAAVASL